MVSVACVGVRISVMFHLMFGHNTFSSLCVVGLLLGNSCPLGLQYFPFWSLELDLAFGKQFVLIVFCLFVIFIYFPLLY